MEVLKPRGNKWILYSTYNQSHSGSNTRRGKYNGIPYIYSKGIYPKLMPTDNIIDQLKKATQQLLQGLYFSFKVLAEDWLAIKRHTEITMFCDKTNIYTILRFPLIAQPTYNLINAIALTIHDYDNIFIATEINNNLITSTEVSYCNIISN